ncbi:MAG: hypothetical protein SPI77_00825 [Corynebacterium sp.]|nr:hypothetical protein [Corynebacterium sp.]
MSLFTSAALRMIPGAFILNSGLGKLKADPETSAGLQQFAATGIKQVEKLPSDKFAKIIGSSEVALATTLLALPIPNIIAGAGLTAFGAGLLTMYFGNENNTESDGIRPSHDGLLLAKDSWLVALGLGLVGLGIDKCRMKKAHRGLTIGK